MGVSDALRGHTEGGAIALGRDDLGTLEVGSGADMVVLNLDPRDLELNELAVDITVDQVWVAGRQVK
jgi:cytosine/adenosine deaminase-related metal-dependent hydrolase